MRLRTPIQLIILLALCGGGPAAVADTIYRWTDERGNPVISDRPPPPGTPFTTLNPQFGGKRKPPDTPAKPAFGRPGPAVDTTADAAPATDPEKIPELCQQARDNIYKLETFARIRTYDATGEARYISEEERATQLENAKAIEAKHCDD